VCVGDVRLQIEDRRAIEHVGVTDVQGQSLYAFESHDGHAERIGPMGGACCKDTFTPASAAWGEHFGPPTGVEVEPEDHPDQLPTCQVFERVLEVTTRQQLDQR